MSKTLHYHSTLPKWRFWARMTRSITDHDGKVMGFMKKSWTQTVTFLDENRNIVVKPQLKFGFLADLFDEKGKNIGSIKKVKEKTVGSLFPNAEVWGVVKNDVKYLSLFARERNKVVNTATEYGISIGHADNRVELIVKDGHTIATLIPTTGGFFETFDLILEKEANEEDRLLCLMLFGYKMHGLLK